MNRVRPFREKDLDIVFNRDAGWNMTKEVMMPLAINSEAWTFEDDIGPYVIVGCYRVWQGVAAAWMLADKRMHWTKGAFITKHMKRLLANYCESNAVNRVNGVVDSRFHNYDRWIELIGFQLEYAQKAGAPGNASDLLNYVYWRAGYEQAEHARDRLSPDVEELQRIHG